MLDPTEDTVSTLREAIRHSPDNAPLRCLLAGALAALDRHEDAAAEYRRALALGAGRNARLGLCRAFAAQSKISEALVVAEDLVAAEPADAPARLLLARLLLAGGERDRARADYLRAVTANPALADAELARRLGLRAPAPEESGEPPREAEVGETRADEADGDGEGEGEGPVGATPRLRVRTEADGDGPELAAERPRIDFTAVGGMEALKEEIRMKIVLPLQRPELFRSYGKKVGGGILLYGPPGCGKTLLARATAGEVQASFLSVGIHEVLDMWLGESERRLHELFAGARRAAPCVLFFDEVDALGASRQDLRRSAGRTTINQFLAELDGVRDSNDGLLVLAATNAPWHLDPAFRRPGRFDRIIFVPPPDEEARRQILAVLLRERPCGKLDLAKVAAKTRGCSGADLAALVERAAESRLGAALRSGVAEPIGTADLLQAAKGLRSTTQEWFATARNHALYANQGGHYDDVLRYLESDPR